MIRSICLAAALLGGSAAVAQTTTANSSATSSGSVAATTAQTTANASPEKMICERQEVLGSRLQGRRVCKTASQWAEDRRAQRAEIDRIQTERTCNGGASGRC